MPDVVNSVVINYKSVGLDKVGADLKGASAAIDGLVVSSATAFKATTELENKFKGLQKSTNAYTTALSEARGAALGLAAGIGPVGAVLGSFGPWGIAAAAGVGLVTSAFTYLSESAGKMGDEAVKLKQFSDNTGLTTTQVRGLSEAGQELGVSADSIKSGLEKFTVGLSEVRDGSGDLFKKLKDIDEQLAIQMSQTRDSGQALDLLAKAYNSTADATTKAALARAAFGRGGVGVGQVLGVVNEGIDKYSQAVEKSLGVTGEMTKRMAELTNANKDLADDIKTVEGVTLGAIKTLETENRLLKIRLDILKQTAEYTARGGTGPTTDEFGQPFDFTLLNQNRAAAQSAAQSGEAGRGGMARDTAAAAAATAAEVAKLEDKWRGVSKETRAASEIAEAMLPTYMGLTGEAQRQAQFDADITVELLKQKTAAEALVIAADKMIARDAQKLAAAVATTRSLEEQNEMAKARNVTEEKRIASAQAYKKVIEELGDTDEAHTAAQQRSHAVEESYRIRAKQQLNDMGVSSKVLRDSGKEASDESIRLGRGYEGAANWAAQLGEDTDTAADAAERLAAAIEEATRNGQLLDGMMTNLAANVDTFNLNYAPFELDQASANKASADLARRIQYGNFDPATMPRETLGYGGSSDLNAQYFRGRGEIGAGGPGVLLGLSSQGYMDPAAVAEANKAYYAQQNLTDSVDKLTGSTDRLNATNQELLSPYYTMDPRTSHIGFRSQGMAAGGYVDVPGSPSANDNMIAQIPVASGERIYVDPMSVKRGNAGVTINITAPMMFSGPVNKDEVGRTVYQSMQIASRSIAAAQR